MSLPIPAGTYAIDDVHSQIGFKITHMGLTVVRGTFNQFSGSLTVGETLEDTSAEIDAVTDSVASSNPGRDEVIRGEDFFHTAAHPTMTFRSGAARRAGDDYELDGDLTIKGTTRPVTLSVVYTGDAVFFLDGSTHFGFKCSGRVSRSEFGVAPGLPGLSDEVDLELEIQFVRPAAE